MLHTINKSPFEKNSLHDCSRFLIQDDVILLYEDAVYAATPDTRKSELIENIVKSYKVYALGADLKARGISKLISGVEIADYDKFVDLVVEHKIQAWL
jgi:tRNA 2-thiouridine synthesizing protein B